MLAIQATGRVVRDQRGLELIVTRLVPASLTDTWGWLTTPAKLKKWLGAVTITQSSELSRFTATVGGSAASFSVVETEGGTRIFVHERLAFARDAGATGPAWEYRLDRLLARISGATPPNESEYATQRPYYERLAMDGDPNSWPVR